jgi:catechol 2,3-dioxygenase-like lactoylglutathione lyase family enzyme
MIRPRTLVAFACLALAAPAAPGAGAGAAEPLPIDRLAMVTFRGADLERTRKFYGEILGLEEVRPSRDVSRQAQAPTAIFQVNDDQFLEFRAGEPGKEPFRLERISLLAPDLERAREWVARQQLRPTAIEDGTDGNPHFTLTDPDGITVDFVAYRAGSWQAGARGKGARPRRISAHLQHAGLAVASEPDAKAFYYDRLGFRERNRGGPMPGETRWIVVDMPGSHGDFIEFMVHQPEPPERRQHLCFGVPDIDRTHQELIAAGVEQKFKPFVTPSGLRLMNVRDPNGMRVEFWEEKPGAKTP